MMGGGGAECSFRAPDSILPHEQPQSLSNCRNSPPSSVSLPNYVEGLSFFFPICQCFESILLKINFTSNMALLFMIHLD